jgi:hypothetical protein
MGAKVKDPVTYDPQTGRFASAEDYARERRDFDRAHLRWLLDLGQREDDSLLAGDDVMFAFFVGPHIEIEKTPSPATLLRTAKETVASIRRSVLEHTSWEFQVPAMSNAVEWFGFIPISWPKTADWLAAFRLRAVALLIEHYERIRECGRNDCKRLFLAVNNRKEFCSKKCSDKEQFERYVKRIGGKDKWLEKHSEQYHARKSAADAQAASPSGDPSEAVKHPKHVKQRSGKTL